jgi:hypothetical protein
MVLDWFGCYAGVVVLTSRKPDMKFLGSLSSPLKFSSLKYDMICVVWRQKFIVSYNPGEVIVSAIRPRLPYAGK